VNPNDWKDGGHGFDKSLPPWWINLHGYGFWSFYRYHAIRNPANGLRAVEWLDLDIEREKARFVGDNYPKGGSEPAYMREHGIKSVKYLAWQGVQAGFKYIRLWNDERHIVIKFGWRIEPRDALADAEEYRRSAGFATKLIIYRKG